MQPAWLSQQILEDHRRGLVAAGEASRAARAARREAGEPGGRVSRQPARDCASSSLRAWIGWWLVHAGLRLVASRPVEPEVRRSGW